MKPTLFQILLGAKFYALPTTVKDLHSTTGQMHYQGRAQISRGKSMLSKLCAVVSGLPSAHDEADIRVVITAQNENEVWERHFKTKRMRSLLTRKQGCLQERLGLVTFLFKLHVHANELHWSVEKVRVANILPLPASWFTHVIARESEKEGKYHFYVDVQLPLVGELINYQGWLEHQT